MTSFAEFCIMAMLVFAVTELYVAINDLSLRASLHSFTIGFFFSVANFGILLALNEYVFVKYLKKVVFKKQLSFDHDFVGLWLEITNIVLGFCLAIVHVTGAMYAKNTNLLLWYLGALPNFRYQAISMKRSKNCNSTFISGFH